VSDRRIITVVTGSRAEFGLLRPVMRAIARHDELELRVVVTGTHLLPPAQTKDEVAAEFDVHATIEMQRADETGRLADAAALGRGVSGFAKYFGDHPPNVVLVLGDRIEAFAAAAAASVAGIRVAHVHGGDVAEGIADEAMRHAITKLAHIHFPATARSAERIIAMGEEPQRTHLVGSPAIDDIADIPPLTDEAYEALGRPEIVFLLHPTGRDEQTERTCAEYLLALCQRYGRVLALHPNHDPGREAILSEIERVGGLIHRAHMDRRAFIGLLRRARMIVGNSSAGLIECAAIPCRCVNVGNRQAGRERLPHVLNCPQWDFRRIEEALQRAMTEPVMPFRHVFGDGHSGEKTAEILAGFDSDKHRRAKRNTY
jgi:UDP-hydrolysing UDP-N-acetyl-D-glucosamine 2-epimerase